VGGGGGEDEGIEEEALAISLHGFRNRVRGERGKKKDYIGE